MERSPFIPIFSVLTKIRVKYTGTRSYLKDLLLRGPAAPVDSQKSQIGTLLRSQVVWRQKE